MLNKLKELWATEPIRVISVVVAVIAFVAGNFGVVVDEVSLVDSIVLALGALGVGQFARSKVTPA